MSRGEGDEERVALDLLDHEPVPIHGKVDEARIEGAVDDCRHLFGAAHVTEGELHSGKAPGEPPDRRREDAARGHEPELEVADLPPASLLRHPDRVLGLGERASRLREKRRPGSVSATLRELRLKEGHAELLLETAHHLAEGRLADLQTRSGPTEMQLLGQGHEVAQVLELHGPSRGRHVRALSISLWSRVRGKQPGDLQALKRRGARLRLG